MNLDRATAEHRAAVAGLAELKREQAERLQVARERLEATRRVLADAIVAEALAGTAQKDIITRTGYARETVRTILRAGGVEPD